MLADVLQFALLRGRTKLLFQANISLHSSDDFVQFNLDPRAFPLKALETRLDFVWSELEGLFTYRTLFDNTGYHVQIQREN